jgi:hypothetical protein
MKAKPFIINGTVMMLFSLMTLVTTSNAYGNNFVAETPKEAIADLTSMIGVLAGYILVTIGTALRKDKEEKA